MNRNGIALLVAAALVIGLGSVFVWQAAAAQPTPPASSGDGPRTITVVGTGTVNARPDQAVIRLGVYTDADKATDALSANSARMQAVIDALKAAGIADADIQTQGINVSPRYAPDGTSAVTGFTATNVVSVRVRDVAKAGDVLDAALTAGANTVEGLYFEIGEQDALLGQAREAAMANAKQTAEQLAKLAGGNLGAVVSISESASMPQPFMYDRAAQGMGGAAPIEPGTQAVQTVLQVTYLLAD